MNGFHAAAAPWRHAKPVRCPKRRELCSSDRSRNAARSFLAGLGWSLVCLLALHRVGLAQGDGAVSQNDRGPTAEERTAAELAREILDEQLAREEREARVREAVPQAAAVVRAMAGELPPGDEDEEYRRIPWMWRVSIAAGRSLDKEIVLPLFVASLPAEGEPLRDWQSVVLGGGVINGISLEERWPREVIQGWLAEHPDLRPRWQRVFRLAAEMADNERVRKGTRYDALRILGVATWEESGTHLVRYLAQGVDAELQMGAVSGLVDIDAPQAAKALTDHLGQLTPGNRQLALRGMLRSPERRIYLRDLIATGQVPEEWLSDEQRQRLAPE